jgi:Arc/MetJ-type ribon-helix-helix transcriptional regulator
VRQRAVASLARTFGFDVLACPRCGGRLRLIALLDASAVTQRILRRSNGQARQSVWPDRRSPDRRSGPGCLTVDIRRSHITSVALARKKATTIALDPQDDRLLSQAARERGVSRSEFIRQHLALVLEQYRRHPKPRSAGALRDLPERGDERELFRADRSRYAVHL